MNSSNASAISLEEENIYEFKRIGVTTFVYLIIVCIVGTIGNLHVLLVYSLRYKANIYKTFILCLSGVDFLACTFCIPSVLFIVSHPNTIQSSVFCKISRASVYFVGACSLSLLDVIAVERYRKVCQATRSQFTLRTARIACVSVILFIFLVAVIPVTIIYGINKKKTYYHSLVGFECTVLNEFKTSVFAKIYRGVIFIIFVLLLVVCVSLYGMVGRKIYKHQTKYHTRKKADLKCFSIRRKADSQVALTRARHEFKLRSHETEISSNTTSNSLETAERRCVLKTVRSNDIEVSASAGDLKEANAQNNDLNDEDQNMSKDICKIRHDDAERKCPESNPNLPQSMDTNIARDKKRKKLTRSRNITIIFMVVSVISFGGYLPYLIFTLIRNVNWQVYDSFSNSAPTLDLFIKWMLFLNNAVNPLVYGFLDTKFRKECKEFYIHIKKYF